MHGHLIKLIACVEQIGFAITCFTWDATARTQVCIQWEVKIFLNSDQMYMSPGVHHRRLLAGHILSKVMDRKPLVAPQSSQVNNLRSLISQGYIYQ